MGTQTANTTFFGRSLVWCTAVAVTSVAAALDPGDMFADRPVISGESGQVSGSTLGATREVGEPTHAGLTGGGSVWRSWTAPATGPVSIDTLGSTFDTLLAVYVGNSVDTLTVMASSDDIQWPSNLLSALQFNAQQGVTYAIAIDGFVGSTGDFTLNWELEPLPPTDYTLTLTSTGHGHVRVNGNIQSLPFSDVFEANAQVLIEAVPLGGWAFMGWSGDLTGTTNPSVVKMTGNWEIGAGFEADSSLSSVNVPWYVDAAGTAQFIPPQDGNVCSIVFLNNATDQPLPCFIEYYSQDGVFIGPFEENDFEIPAGASLAFRPVADDPATVMGGQEAGLGLAVPNRPKNGENGNDDKANGSIVIRFAGDPAVLTGQVQSFSNGHGMGAFSTSYTLPPGVGGDDSERGICTTNVPWYVDNAGVAQGIPPMDGRRMSFVFLHNNLDTDITCVIEYFTANGISIGPETDNEFVIPANASIAFRPVADDPATVAGGQEAPLGRAVPNRPMGTETGNDGKDNGSLRITWEGRVNDVQGVSSTYSYSLSSGAYASSNLLPPAVFQPLVE